MEWTYYVNPATRRVLWAGPSDAPHTLTQDEANGCWLVTGPPDDTAVLEAHFAAKAEEEATWQWPSWLAMDDDDDHIRVRRVDLRVAVAGWHPASALEQESWDRLRDALRPID